MHLHLWPACMSVCVCMYTCARMWVYAYICVTKWMGKWMKFFISTWSTSNIWRSMFTKRLSFFFIMQQVTEILHYFVSSISLHTCEFSSLACLFLGVFSWFLFLIIFYILEHFLDLYVVLFWFNFVVVRDCIFFV